ncbi:MAG: hypothetical protein MUE95_04080 [Cyclobacteriaceae bacterium]|jgi:hypothetical protein|nr:hypothetical protein [Cyclobacteriaceae bacterium]
MNIPVVMARFLLVAYCILLLLFAAGRSISEDAYAHLLVPVMILMVLVILADRYVMSSAALLILFGYTVWYFQTWTSPVIFLTVSVPIAVAAVLFLIGTRAREEE